jgi:hypothetical protein
MLPDRWPTYPHSTCQNTRLNKHEYKGSAGGAASANAIHPWVITSAATVPTQLRWHLGPRVCNGARVPGAPRQRPCNREDSEGSAHGTLRGKAAARDPVIGNTARLRVRAATVLPYGPATAQRALVSPDRGAPVVLAALAVLRSGARVQAAACSRMRPAGSHAVYKGMLTTIKRRGGTHNSPYAARHWYWRAA